MLSTLYPSEVNKIVDAVCKARKNHHKQNENYMIEFAQDIKKAHLIPESNI